ncbi:MAG: hypothetical protein SGPRY_001487 [Prymnesium sp.]
MAAMQDASALLLPTVERLEGSWQEEGGGGAAARVVVAQGALLVAEGRMQLVPRPDSPEQGVWSVSLENVTLSWIAADEILVRSRDPQPIEPTPTADELPSIFRMTSLRVRDPTELCELAFRVGLEYPAPPEAQQAEQPPSTADLAASIITMSGSIAALRVRQGASLLRSGLNGALEAFKEEVVPAPASSSVVCESTKQRLQTARVIAGSAEEATRCVGDHVAAVASAVGVMGGAANEAWLLLHAAKAGEAFRGAASGHPVREAIVKLPNALKPTPPIIPQQVGGASICAASEVLEALSSSTFEVVSSGATAASDAIGHRYGEDAGNAAQQGLYGAHTNGEPTAVWAS